MPIKYDELMQQAGTYLPSPLAGEGGELGSAIARQSEPGEGSLWDQTPHPIEFQVGSSEALSRKGEGASIAIAHVLVIFGQIAKDS